jgi:tRNA pseudouridine38-40 synthase
MRNIKCVIAYDGSGFFGWQIQDNARTVQATIEEGLGAVLGHKVRVIASGRTDTGVHAFAQVINFPTESTIPTDGLVRGLNSVLPGDVAVLSAENAAPEFHARFMAKGKTYVYVMHVSPVRNPFLDRYALHVKRPLDVDAMRESAGLLLGEHDFASFQAAGSPVKTTRRVITASEVSPKGDKVYFRMQGSGFLRHMVRNIAGTLLLVGSGKLSPQDMQGILALKDRGFAGPTAPPQGLYLVGVDYGSGA